MAININTVADSTSTVPANSEEETSGLPEEILAMPVFKGILEGTPAALWVKTGSKTPEAVAAVRHGKKLNEVGLFFDRSKEEGVDILWNAQYLSPQLVESAKKKGKLKEIASPLDEVLASINGTGAAPETEGGALPASGMPSPVPVDSALNTARTNSLQPGGPTSGNYPGGGRIINEITKNAI